MSKLLKMNEQTVRFWFCLSGSGTSHTGDGFPREPGSTAAVPDVLLMETCTLRGSTSRNERLTLVWQLWTDLKRFHPSPEGTASVSLTADTLRLIAIQLFLDYKSTKLRKEFKIKDLF